MHLTDNKTLAAILHSIGALVAIGTTVYIWRNSSDTTARLITLFVVPALISPYYFDYDLTGIGLIFALMMAEASKKEPRKFDLIALTGLWTITIFMLIGKINFVFTGPIFLLALLYYATIRATKSPTAQQSRNP